SSVRRRASSLGTVLATVPAITRTFRTRLAAALGRRGQCPARAAQGRRPNDCDKAMRRRFTWKLFLSLLIGGGALGVGVHFLHAHQLEQMASRLRAQATAALQEGDYYSAGQFLTRFLAILPGDVDALAEYGLVLQIENKHERALEAYKQVLV